MSLLSRRKFLIASGATAVGAAAIGGPRYVFAAPGSPNTGDSIIVIHLRGGADGIQMAGPTQTNAYQQLRKGAAVNNGLALNAGSAPGATFSNETLSLHPAMDALYNGLWAEGKMAIIPACGIPENSINEGRRGNLKSHFDAERFNANTQSSTSDGAAGWLGRMVEAQGSASAVGAISKGKHYLNGTATVDINDLESLSTDGGLDGFRDGEVARVAIAQMVSGEDSISMNGQRALESITSLEDLDPSVLRPNYPNSGFGRSMAEIATVLSANIGLQAAQIDFGGWDHHGNIGPQFGDKIREVSDAIQQLSADTNGLEEITVIVTTEFGRTVEVNGGGGTDHGRARTELVMGAGITGGVFGDYPDQLTRDSNGLDRNALPVAVDYRQVIADIVTARGDVADPTAVIPGFTPGNALGFA